MSLLFCMAGRDCAAPPIVRNWEPQVWEPLGTFHRLYRQELDVIQMESMNAPKATRDFSAPLGAGGRRSGATLTGE